jgi:hypothetical protein
MRNFEEPSMMEEVTPMRSNPPVIERQRSVSTPPVKSPMKERGESLQTVNYEAMKSEFEKNN